MAEVEVLNVSARETRGKRNAKRMRANGNIPAVLYGHGKETISLTIPAPELEHALRHGSRVVDLKGSVEEQAMILEMQWDTWHQHVLHLDLARVSKDEKVRVEVHIELRGDPPGVKEGGVLNHVMHAVEVESVPALLPEKLELNVNELGLNQTLTVADLEVPEGVKVLAEPDAPVLQCNEPLEAEEVEEELGAEAAQPEVIGRKAEEESEED